MAKYNIDVVEIATKTVNIMPETPFEKVVADCMTDYLEMRKAEEQGALLRLPCPIGTTVYCIENEYEDIFIEDSKYHFVGEEKFDTYMSEYFGETVFLTREEAEQALKQMGE